MVFHHSSWIRNRKKTCIPRDYFCTDRGLGRKNPLNLMLGSLTPPFLQFSQCSVLHECIERDVLGRRAFFRKIAVVVEQDSLRCSTTSNASFRIFALIESGLLSSSPAILLARSFNFACSCNSSCRVEAC